MPVAPVAHHVDDDVFLELLAEREREPRHPHRRFGIVAVHVEDRRLHRLGDVGGVHGGAREAGSGREADLVVHDDVDRAADVVPGELREVQGLGDHTLARECSVAVQEHGQNEIVLIVSAASLLGTHHSLDDGIDRFEVTRVRSQRDPDRFGRAALELAGRADVVLHVAGTLRDIRVELALELPEDLGVRLADDVREHVEPAAMRHAHHDLGHSRVGGGVEEEREQRDERLRAFEAEALLPEELRVQESFERLGRVQPSEDGPLVVVGHFDVHAFDVFLDPRFLIGLLDVHVLDANRARVRVAQDAEDVSQLHDRLAREAAGGELTIEVPDREAPVDRVELRVRVRLLEPEGIEVRDEVAAHPVHVHEVLHRDGLLAVFDRARDRAVILRPARGLVGNAEAGEDLVVETFATDEQIVHRREHLAALRALDDAVVVGARECHDLADTELGERLRIGALVLGREHDRAHTDDHALSGHEPRHRVHRADRARIRDRDGCSGEVVGTELAVASTLHEVFVRGAEAREVERVGELHVRHHQRAGAVGAFEVDREPEVDVPVVHDARLPVDHAEARVHRGHAA